MTAEQQTRVDADALYAEIEACAGEVDRQIAEVKAHVGRTAALYGNPDTGEPGYDNPYARTDATGRPLLTDLLCARAVLLAALANRPREIVVEPPDIRLPSGSVDSDLIGAFPAQP